MDNQEAFSRVVTHLRKQGQKSLLSPGGGSCAYRSPYGDRCAAGVLLTDEFYDASIEGAGLYNDIERIMKLEVDDSQRSKLLRAREIFIEALPNVSLELIEQLQLVHDHSHPSFWEQRWKMIARDFGLTIPSAETPHPSEDGVPEDRSCVDSPSAQERETVLA